MVEQTTPGAGGAYARMWLCALFSIASGCALPPSATEGPEEAPKTVAPKTVAPQSVPSLSGLEMKGVVLYQLDEVLTNRVSAESLSSYILELKRVTSEFFAEEKAQRDLDVVAVIRPGARARFWLRATPPLDDKTLVALKAKLAGEPVIDVYGGPVALALIGAVAGGTPSATYTTPPVPEAWREATGNGEADFAFDDAFFHKIWPDERTDANNAPLRFVEQTLELTGGKILRPDGWFYSEHSSGSSVTWTISKENIEAGDAYETGVRVQAVFRASEALGGSPGDYLRSFAANKERTADTVISSCREEEHDGYRALCLDVIEKPYRVKYSLMWSDTQDYAVVLIAGTPEALWPVYSETFEKMSKIELLGADAILIRGPQYVDEGLSAGHPWQSTRTSPSGREWRARAEATPQISSDDRERF